jgi:hypothetical protein
MNIAHQQKKLHQRSAARNSATVPHADPRRQDLADVPYLKPKKAEN